VGLQNARTVELPNARTVELPNPRTFLVFGRNHPYAYRNRLLWSR
jgi:hypothetical protein